MLYCIEVKREFEEDNSTHHHDFDKHPTEEDVVKFLSSKEIEYDANYNKLVYYEVKPD